MAPIPGRACVHALCSVCVRFVRVLCSACVRVLCVPAHVFAPAQNAADRALRALCVAQAGPLAAVDFVAEDIARSSRPSPLPLGTSAADHGHVSVWFLMPCHAAPLFSHLHLPGVRPVSLDCSPRPVPRRRRPVHAPRTCPRPRRRHRRRRRQGPRRPSPPAWTRSGSESERFERDPLRFVERCFAHAPRAPPPAAAAPAAALTAAASARGPPHFMRPACPATGARAREEHCFLPLFSHALSLARSSARLCGGVRGTCRRAGAVAAPGRLPPRVCVRSRAAGRARGGGCCGAAACRRSVPAVN